MSDQAILEHNLHAMRRALRLMEQNGSYYWRKGAQAWAESGAHGPVWDDIHIGKYYVISRKEHEALLRDVEDANRPVQQKITAWREQGIPFLWEVYFAVGEIPPASGWLPGTPDSPMFSDLRWAYYIALTVEDWRKRVQAEEEEQTPDEKPRKFYAVHAAKLALDGISAVAGPFETMAEAAEAAHTSTEQEHRSKSSLPVGDFKDPYMPISIMELKQVVRFDVHTTTELAGTVKDA